jgi:hypothetical protein
MTTRSRRCCATSAAHPTGAGDRTAGRWLWQADAGLARDFCDVASFLATPADVFAGPGVADRVVALGGNDPRYPLPGPSRAELLAAIG